MDVVYQKAVAFADERVVALQSMNSDAMWQAAWRGAQNVLVAGNADKTVCMKAVTYWFMTGFIPNSEEHSRFLVWCRDLPAVPSVRPHCTSTS
jgi:hypothetical protein